MKNILLRPIAIYTLSVLSLSLLSSAVQAGPHGSEFDLTLTPAAGGMEGVGIARPQDPVAMLFANPATLTQLEGKNAFTIGATYASPDLDAKGEPTDLFGGTASAGTFNPQAALTGPFEDDSSFTTAVAPHAVVIQRLSDKLVAGFGLTGVSGLGSEWRNTANLPNLIADLGLFGTNMSVGYQVSDKLSVGATFTFAIASLQVGLTESGSTVHELGIGGSLGMTYDAGPAIIGASYKSPVSITYSGAIETAPDVFSDFKLEQPQEVQLGIATSKAWSENTLIELDFRYKNWDSAAGYSSFWKDQYIYSLGGQHKIGNAYLRAGYSYNSKIAKNAEDLGNSFGNISFVKNPGFADPNQPPSLPVTPTFLQLAQATIADGHWQQSFSLGLGYDIPGTNIRLDLNTSYAFDGGAELGPFHANGSLLTAGMGLTWLIK